MVGAFPSAILGKVALVPGGAEGVCGDVNGNAQMVPGETEVLDAVRVRLVERAKLEKAHVLRATRSPLATVSSHPHRQGQAERSGIARLADAPQKGPGILKCSCTG